jgi:L-fuconate dehydratase
MRAATITDVKAQDRRLVSAGDAGSDAIHHGGECAFAVTRIFTDRDIEATGITLVLGNGNPLVCEVIEQLGAGLAGYDIEELMAEFGMVSRKLAGHPALRWLGPQKGAVHLALASLVNACFDLWAKTRGLPLWRLLLDLTPEQMLALLDLSYMENDLGPQDVLTILREQAATREDREAILRTGYPGYDTSVGWFQHSDERVRRKAKMASDTGFGALKLKVGSRNGDRDVRRATMLREIAGPNCRLLLDANQQWSLKQARCMCAVLRPMDPYWIEGPTHPDDVEAHRLLAGEIDPMRLAIGKYVPNRVLFKNYIQAGAVHFVQADCTRLAGISEFLTVSLLARKHGLQLVPHVGDMGQIHQHLVLVNHVALGHDVLFLEHVPNARKYFVHPARVCRGVYQTPEEPGASCDLSVAPK